MTGSRRYREIYPFEVNRHEVMVEQALADLGIDFFHQHRVRGVRAHYLADFFVPYGRVLIEVDGPSHDALRDRDAARDTQVTAVGYRLIRLTHTEVSAPGLRGRLLALLGTEAVGWQVREH